MRAEPLPLHCRDEACPLYSRCDAIPAETLTTRDDSRVQVLFVGEAPGKTEVDKRRPFIGESGRLLRRALDYAAPASLDYGFSNVVRCLPLDGASEIRKPNAIEVKHCRDNLYRDIRAMDPDVLVLLGATAVELLIPERPTVYQERGRWRRQLIEGRERFVLTTWHPAYCLRQRSAVAPFYTDLDRKSVV